MPDGEDKTVEHVVLVCVKYARERNEMMQVVLRELRNVRVEMTGRVVTVCVIGVTARTVCKHE